MGGRLSLSRVSEAQGCRKGPSARTIGIALRGREPASALGRFRQPALDRHPTATITHPPKRKLGGMPRGERARARGRDGAT